MLGQRDGHQPSYDETLPSVPHAATQTRRAEAQLSAGRKLGDMLPPCCIGAAVDTNADGEPGGGRAVRTVGENMHARRNTPAHPRPTAPPARTAHGSSPHGRCAPVHLRALLAALDSRAAVDTMTCPNHLNLDNSWCPPLANLCSRPPGTHCPSDAKSNLDR